MQPRHGGSNRLLLSLCGLLLLLGGVAWALVILEPRLGFYASLGLTAPTPQARVTDLPLTGWPAALLLGVLGLLAAVIGLWLALRQVPSRREAPSYSWQADQSDGSTSAGSTSAGSTSAGSTVVDTSALGQAIADDAQGLSGVSTAKVLLFGAAASPELLVQIQIDDRADIRSVLGQLEQVVLPNAQDAIGTPLHHVGIRVRTGGRSDSAGTVDVHAAPSGVTAPVR